MRRPPLFNSQYHPIIWIMVAALLFGLSLSTILAINAECEATDDNYNIVAHWAEHEEKMRPKIKEALDDHILTKHEYSQLLKLKDRINKSYTIERALKP